MRFPQAGNARWRRSALLALPVVRQARRLPHLEQNASVGPSGYAQVAQAGRGLGGWGPLASGRMGWMGVPHLVQNLSLGTPPLPHAGHVQPVRRNRARREPGPWNPYGTGSGGTGAGGAGMGAGWPGMGAGGSGPAVGLGGDGSRCEWLAS